MPRRHGRRLVIDDIGALGDEQLDSLCIGSGQAGDADVGTGRTHLERGEAQRPLDRAAVDIDVLDAAERQRLDPVGDHTAAQRQVVLAKLIGEPSHFQHSANGGHHEQEQDTSADQQRHDLLIDLHRDDDGGDGDGDGRQGNARQADPQVAGVDGHECVIAESREVIGRDRFVAERIGHTCFLATPGGSRLPPIS